MKELDRNSKVSGPGEVLRELGAALRIKVSQGELDRLDAQEYYNRIHLALNLWALAYPDCPWETGSTQAKELESKEKELRARVRMTPSQS